MQNLRKTLLLFGLLTGALASSFAQDSLAIEDDFFDLSLEDLMNMEITSVSKKAERLQDVSTSIYVITQEDIRRSGATRFQDLLSMVPGAFVNNNNFNDVEFGIRENADAYSASVLVLIDNVPYMSPFTSAFDFAGFDMDFDEIDRIEVIKGPGGTIYGANAATGIINIFTKNPEDSQGLRANITAGSRGFVAPSLRYGTTIGTSGHLSAYIKARVFEGFRPLDEISGSTVTVPITNPDGTSSGDTTITNKFNDDVYNTQKIIGGINYVDQISEKTSIQSRFFFTTHKRNLYFPSPTQGLFLIEPKTNNLTYSLRADHNFTETHSLFAQVSVNRNQSLGGIGDQNTTVSNLEIQDNWSKGIHHISGGVNLRSVSFNIGDYAEEVGMIFLDPKSTEYLWGVFAQHKLKFGDKFDFTYGAKAETWTLIDNDPELSPSARFAYRPNENMTIWGAASRSVTTPGFIQTNIDLTLAQDTSFVIDTVFFGTPVQIPISIPRMALINSDQTNQSSYLTAELGVKGKFSDKARYDISGFYSQGKDLIAFYLNLDQLELINSDNYIPSPVNGETIYPGYYANLLTSKNFGGEALIKYNVASWLTVEGSYSMYMSERSGQTIPNDTAQFVYEAPENSSTPRHIARLRTYFTFPQNIELSINTMYHTVAGANRFYYDRQLAIDLTSADTPYELHEQRDRVRVDFKIEKIFNDGNASVYIWGSDITNGGRIQNYNSFATGIPFQTHAIVGFGASVGL